MMALAIGLCLDLIFGDPVSLPHPIRFIGKAIERVEAMLRSKNDSARALKTKGLLLWLLIIKNAWQKKPTNLQKKKFLYLS